MHVTAPAAENEPAAQVMQLAWLLAPVPANEVPAGQLRQVELEEAPTVVEYVPEPQEMQMLDALALENVPA